jgi:hypothetical protein
MIRRADRGGSRSFRQGGNFPGPESLVRMINENPGSVKAGVFQWTIKFSQCCQGMRVRRSGVR